MKKTGIILIYFFTITAIAFAQWQTGNDLVNKWLEYKKDTSNYISKGIYLGYIMGVLDSLVLTEYIMKETKYGNENLGFKIPDNSTVGQICSVVGKYLDNHPEQWNLPAHLLVVSALREYFPR